MWLELTAQRSRVVCPKTELGTPILKYFKSLNMHETLQRELFIIESSLF